MNSVALPVVLIAATLITVVTIGRCFLVRARRFERQINAAMVWQMVGILLFMAASALGLPDLATRLYLGCGFMTYARLHGFAVLLQTGDEAEAARRQPIYDKVGALVAVVMIAGAPSLDRAFAIDTVAVFWHGATVSLLLTSIRIASACVRELRGAPKSFAERLVYAGVLFIAVYWMASSVVVLTRALARGRLQLAGPLWSGLGFVAMVILTLLIAIPLVNAVLARTGWDRTGRAVRTLRPLWRDLTAAVPEVVLSADRRTAVAPELRLYRMTVEIRDALTRLRRDDLIPRATDIGAELDQLLELAQSLHTPYFRRRTPPSFAERLGALGAGPVEPIQRLT
ncbi:DUF6545 domain-containing protein [Nocardia sp. NPDC048505]|uniref:DUF6545 domain-containing protein n=1 Tax=unclassified Nocardia TaxID=2637762 RepID=UPI0033CB719D